MASPPLYFRRILHEFITYENSSTLHFQYFHFCNLLRIYTQNMDDLRLSFESKFVDLSFLILDPYTQCLAALRNLRLELVPVRFIVTHYKTRLK